MVERSNSKVSRILGTLLAVSIIGASIYWLVSLMNGIKTYEDQGHAVPFQHISVKIDY